MIDMTFLPSAISGLKTAAEIASALVKAKTQVEINAKAIELQDAIISAQNNAFNAHLAQVALHDENRELKKQLADIEAYQREMKRYALAAPWPGSVVYALKKIMSYGEPPHYTCANCHQSHKKSILSSSKGESGFAYYKCPNCTASIATGYRGNPAAEYAPE